MRPLPCCAVAVMLRAHMQLIAAFSHELFCFGNYGTLFVYLHYVGY